MARRETGHTTGSRRPRTGPGAVALTLPVLLVLALLALAVVADDRRWGPTHLGWRGGDPAVDPAAVALPAGLDLPEVADPPPVAEPAAPDGVDLAAVRKALARPLRDADLGPHVVAAVASLDGPGIALQRGRDPLVPASTTKLLTATAALAALGPDATFETTVVTGDASDQVVLVGGGDPLLAAEPADPEGDVWPVRADVATLAAETAAALRERGVRRVQVRYDDSLFAGPAVNPRWEPSYVPDQVVTPTSALWVDGGRDPSGWGRVGDAPRAAATTFADALRDEGVRVSRVRAGRAPEGSEQLAAVSSPPLDQVVQWLVDVSDNETTEVVLRHVGLAVVGEGSTRAGLDAVRTVLADLGVDETGLELHDGSGLSRDNGFAARTLVDVLRVAASDDHPELRAVIEGLPVAGFTGSLAARFSEDASDGGLGRVRAKTGTLTGVHALAGLVTGADGVPMVVVLAADRVAADKSLDARAALDRAAAALATCACGSATGSDG
ncbi:D-alanyl-D-alanine carboxypeptidase/D-alanyl-D-alanine-endopeptidase [Nocardioides sp. Y6]|uniref:D-alanyl-D-alanine carboxypeptidase/D-alanyl-D-alanine-endopeptidase n=1 Tax=Nocardioides malaquae TaxID=2773426 RepID=A0ABR9RV73_9ACTN|nr:D-alanyl-D-alanine carboxypeptidase/D-alanyl-D-alanine-endopeptidase [Nocardioides malaquae]MBE7325495.1 D-alanyl-D-alanine carboxypeptidase/D-alanyl-D-alanine-endopeptidase [Nocardioides malaquae]